MKKLYAAKIKNLKPILQLILVMVLALSSSFSTFGQVRVDFTPRASVFTPDKTIYNVKGDFTMMGNTNLTLVNYDDNSNNSGDMKYVDVDNDPNTLNSSAATLKFSDALGINPDCSNIVYAGLYWTGRANGSNSFKVTKNILTGNTVTQQATSTPIIYNGDGISNTNYTLTITQSGNTNIYSFLSSGSGDKVDFYYTTGNNAASRTLKVSVNNGPQTNLATSSIDNFNAYLSAPYTIFSSSDYTLTLNRLRLSGSDRAYVEVNYTETVNEYVQVTKDFDKRKVSIKGPNATGYTQLTANGSDIYYPSGTDGDMYSAYVDVTDYVKNNGKDGQYHIADIALLEGNGGGTGYYGGWGMVVVYENSKMGWKDITVFDGHGYVQGSTTVSHTLDVAGFNSTQSGPVNLKLGVMAGEGDRSISGDYFKIQKHSDNTFESLTHSGNSRVNFFNSSIQTDAPRFPDLLNNTGLDISMFDLDNSNNAIIGNNQTTTRFQYGSTQDTYIIFNVTFAVDAYIPESEGLLSVVNINGTTPTAPFISQPGNDIEYSLEIRNKGTEAIENAKLVIPVPFTSEFVPGSITFNEYNSLFDASAPYYDPNEGATGSIVWDIALLPLDADITALLANIRFKLKTTEDCSILVNNNCAPKIVILGGYITGTGVNSKVDYELPLIQGYQQDGACQGEPNTDPISVDIDAEQYIIDNCTGISIEREFLYCSVLDNGIPVSEIQAQFPQGSLFYDSYPVTDASIQYTATNPFPSTIGESTYYAVPPGISICSYIFTIEVNQITTSPSVSNVAYCLNESANPLSAQASNPDYTVFYYADNNPNTIGQTSLVPDTSVAGEFTYYVSEGPSVDCVNIIKTPLVVTVNGGLIITLDEQVNNTCTDSTNGSLDISISGGSGNYTYQWDDNGLQNPGANTQDLTNLTDGTYTVVVSDVDSNCSATASFIITTETVGTIEITAPTAINVNGCTVEDITNDTLTTLAYSESSVTISTAEFLAEGGTFNGDDITNVTYSDSATGTCPIVITRTFTVMDGCGQAASSTQTISIENNVAPTLVAPQDEVVECGNSTEPSATGTATVSDSCGTVNLTFEDSIVEECGNTQTITRTWSATDACDNVSTAKQIITVVDTTAPTIVIPEDVTIECSAASRSIDDAGVATATDSCGEVTITNEDVLAYGCGNTISITRTWTATDDCGNTASGVQLITVIDTTPPVLTVPSNSTVECSESTEPDATGNATAIDTCGEVIVTYTDASVDACGETKTITRTWTATDACGNIATQDQIITVVDTTAPILSLPADITLECSNLARMDPTAYGVATAIDACGSVDISFVDTAIESCGNSQIISRTWTATDSCGNSISDVQTISIVDTTAPVITNPATNIDVECDSNGSDVSLEDWLNTNGGATAIDSCSDTLIWTNNYNGTTSDCSEPVTVIFTVTDECGYSTSTTATYTIQDSNPPAITPAADATVDCDGNGNTNDLQAWLNNNGGATATDACSSVTWSNNFTALSDECGATGAATVTFTASDGCGNTSSTTATFTITDVDSPLITAAAQNLTVDCDGDGNLTDLQAWLDNNAGAQAFENCSEITWSNNYSALTNTCGNTGSVIVLFTATDACGLSSSTSGVFTIVDNTAPMFVETLPSDMTVECDMVPTADILTATDNCGTAEVSYTETRNEGSCDSNYTLLRTWIAKDACGLTTEYIQTITVKDTTAPEITIASTNIIIECDGNGNNGAIEAWLNSNGGATATDNCSSSLTWTNNYNGTASDCSTAIEVIFTATDDCGNSASTTATYTIQDILAPEITQAANLTVECDGIGNMTYLQNWLNGNAGATASDDCSSVTWSNNFNALSDDCGNTGSATVIFTATDSCGNASSTTATFTIVDTAAPIIEALPSETTIDCGLPVEFNQATATDACSSDDVALSFEDVTTAGDCEGAYSVTRTWTATDACGNVATSAQTINVQDVTAPVIAELPAESTVECSVTPDFAQATATDACGSEVTLTFEDVTTAGECEGAYAVTRNWTATDACGNAATATQTINVQDMTAPVIEALPEETTIDCSVTPEFVQATAADACGAEVTLTFEDVTTAGECEGNYAITRTWTATDTCGNAATASQTITVQDSTAPSLVTEYDSEITITCDSVPTVPELVFEDACSSNIDVIFNETSTDTGNVQSYVITRTWNVSDACGNEAVFTQIVNVNIANQITGADTDLCNGDDINFDLFDLLSGTFETSGTWTVETGNATLDGSLFNPYQLDLETYTFKYTLSDEYCTTETLVNITLNDDCVVLPCGAEDVVISKAVTTYTDGKNDFFTITGVETCGFTVELQIFNRWGAMIFESKNYQNDWNGSASRASIGSSNFVPTGTYYYVINLKNSGLKPFAGPIYVATK